MKQKFCLQHFMIKMNFFQQSAFISYKLLTLQQSCFVKKIKYIFFENVSMQRSMNDVKVIIITIIIKLY